MARSNWLLWPTLQAIVYDTSRLKVLQIEIGDKFACVLFAVKDQAPVTEVRAPHTSEMSLAFAQKQNNG